MIEVSRLLIRQLHAVLRRCVRKPYAGPPPLVAFHADSEGLHVCMSCPEVAVEYWQAGDYPSEAATLPLEALANFEGRGKDGVCLEGGSKKVVARWQDAGVPQVVEFDAPDASKRPALPDTPDRLVRNPSALLHALEEANQTASRDAARYAMDHLQLRGLQGEIAATDGRQMLLQGRFDFPWPDDVLIPRCPLFGAKELGQDDPVEIGKTDKHVSLRVGPWTIHLRIAKDVRFPEVTQIIPRRRDGGAHWRIDPEDALFLARSLPRLPGASDEYSPVTVDLGDQVIVRARASGQSQTTEVVLARCETAGGPVRLSINRHMLARLLQLGFREAYVASADKPLVCQDGQRTYVCMPLDAKGALAPTADALRIVSAENKPKAASPQPQPRKPTMNTPATNGHANGNGAGRRTVSKDAQPETKGASLSALIAEAQSLKEVLRDVHGRSSRLLAALKRHKRQSRLMQTTLASLRQLQQIDA